jgi:hypothetical protein
MKPTEDEIKEFLGNRLVECEEVIAKDMQNNNYFFQGELDKRAFKIMPPNYKIGK